MTGDQAELESPKIRSLYACLRTTIRAARAYNVGCDATTICNDSGEDSRGSEQVTNLGRHCARDERLVECKGGEVDESSNLSWNGTGEIIIVNLQELHSPEHANIVDASRQLVVVDI